MDSQAAAARDPPVHRLSSWLGSCQPNQGVRFSLALADTTASPRRLLLRHTFSRLVASSPRSPPTITHTGPVVRFVTTNDKSAVIPSSSACPLKHATAVLGNNQLFFRRPAPADSKDGHVHLAPPRRPSDHAFFAYSFRSHHRFHMSQSLHHDSATRRRGAAATTVRP